MDATIKGLPAVPDGWEFSREYRQAVNGELWLGDAGWHAWHAPQASEAKYLVAVPVKALEPEYEEIPVEISVGWAFAGGIVVVNWPCLVDFAGAIYQHPNGHRMTFGFTHPIFVSPDSFDEEWSFLSFAKSYHNHMIRPVAILRKVSK
jgi:hypothetical protein